MHPNFVRTKELYFGNWNVSRNFNNTSGAVFTHARRVRRKRRFSLEYSDNAKFDFIPSIPRAVAESDRCWLSTSMPPFSLQKYSVSKMVLSNGPLHIGPLQVHKSPAIIWGWGRSWGEALPRITALRWTSSNSEMLTETALQLVGIPGPVSGPVWCPEFEAVASSIWSGGQYVWHYKPALSPIYLYSSAQALLYIHSSPI